MENPENKTEHKLTNKVKLDKIKKFKKDVIGDITVDALIRRSDLRRWKNSKTNDNAEEKN